jgi:hypothetical protein
MNLKESLIKNYSKENCQSIVTWVGDNQKRFDELFSLFVCDEYRIVQQSAWPLSYCVQVHPKLIEKHYPKLISNISKPNSPNAVKRNTIRLLQFVAIPKKYHGHIMNICFELIQSIEEKPAVKAFALSVLENLAKLYPEIKPELHLIIKTQMPYESAAFKSRGKKIIGLK